MASSSDNHPHPNSNSTNPNPNPRTSITEHQSNPEMADPFSGPSPLFIDPDSALSNSEFLTRRELLSRRSRKLNELASVYKDHYWELMEEVKHKYREYYWEYGKNPCAEDEEIENLDGDMLGKAAGFSNRCAVQGCKMKSMALTEYCNMHILRDEKQVLYKGCNYVIKSSQAGPILCGKPILRATVPSLCTPHLQKAEKDVARALKKAGLSGPSTTKLAPQFHVIVAEFVNQIQAKRRAAREARSPLK